MIFILKYPAKNTEFVLISKTKLYRLIFSMTVFVVELHFVLKFHPNLECSAVF